MLVSGGLDSVTCLYWALAKFGQVEVVSFDYEQKHRMELEAAQTICRKVGVPHHVIPINSLRFLGGSALTDDRVAIEVPAHGGLPTTFVPGRNMLFLTLAAALAYRKGIKHLVIGVCHIDYSGYPDCRDEAIKSIQTAISLSMDTRFYIHTPLMWLTKAETVQLAQELGALEALAYSHTCYNNVFPPCQTCPACELRAKGFAEAGLDDPLLSRERLTDPLKEVQK